MKPSNTDIWLFQPAWGLDHNFGSDQNGSFHSLCCWHTIVGNSPDPFSQLVPRIGHYWGLLPHNLVKKVTPTSLSLSFYNLENFQENYWGLVPHNPHPLANKVTSLSTSLPFYNLENSQEKPTCSSCWLVQCPVLSPKCLSMLLDWVSSQILFPIC